MSLLGDILDHFRDAKTHPGDEWAFDEDHDSLCLDFWGGDGTKFWLDLQRDNTIHILWKHNGVVRQATYSEIKKDS